MNEDVYISLGSNIQPKKYLPFAVQALGHLGHIQAISHVYVTPPVGPGSQPTFMNASARLAYHQTPQVLADELRSIEAELDRIRTEDKFAPRTIDLDLVVYGKLSIQEEGLQLPDSDILEQAHLALPLAEISPEFTHPTFSRSFSEIAESLLPVLEFRLHRELTERIRECAGLHNHPQPNAQPFGIGYLGQTT